jgi:hypothetical protein
MKKAHNTDFSRYYSLVFRDKKFMNSSPKIGRMYCYIAHANSAAFFKSYMSVNGMEGSFSGDGILVSYESVGESEK